MPRIKKNSDLPDTQRQVSGFPKKIIKKVGIRNVKLPLKIVRRDGSINYSSGDISIYTDLNKAVRGSNMSRYRILIDDYLVHKDLNLREMIREMLPATREKLEATNAFIKIKFDYFLALNAPVSKIDCFHRFPCVLEGILTQENGIDVYKYYLTVNVNYTSLCPCSKNISQYGAHNQRSNAEIKVELNNDKIMWIEDIIDLVEQCASAPIRNILKRNDELYQTELMYENPMFVEDMSRVIAEKLDFYLDKEINDYCIIVEHQESIHQHDCLAILNAGRRLQ
jgi:GTP cyclohydrolase I